MDKLKKKSKKIQQSKEGKLILKSVLERLYRLQAEYMLYKGTIR